jgi:hypothetical protein
MTRATTKSGRGLKVGTGVSFNTQKRSCEVLMPVKVLSVWDGVPEPDAMKAMLAKARDPKTPPQERHEALSYLNGSVKVLSTISQRKPLADYLANQIKSLRNKLY